MLRKKGKNFLLCNGKSLILWVSVGSRRDQGKGDGAAAAFRSQRQGVAIAGRQQRGFVLTAALPDGADCMDDPLCRKIKARTALGLPDPTTAQSGAVFPQRRTGSPMNGAVHPAAPQQAGIGGVHNGVHLKGCDVSLQHGKGHMFASLLWRYRMILEGFKYRSCSENTQPQYF